MDESGLFWQRRGGPTIHQAVGHALSDCYKCSDYTFMQKQLQCSIFQLRKGYPKCGPMPILTTCNNFVSSATIELFNNVPNLAPQKMALIQIDTAFKVEDYN